MISSKECRGSPTLPVNAYFYACFEVSLVVPGLAFTFYTSGEQIEYCSRVNLIDEKTGNLRKEVSSRSVYENIHLVPHSIRQLFLSLLKYY